MLIYILRHGTTEWNNEHKIQGRTDIMLDDMGREMARQTGVRLAEQGVKFDAVYSSPLKRAYETACLVSGADDGVLHEAKGRKETHIITDKRLRELSFGRQEGQKVEAMMYDVSVPFRFFKSEPDKYDELTIHDSDTESLTTLCERAAEFLKEKIEGTATVGGESSTVGEQDRHAADDRKILISGHGALNKALLMHIRGCKSMPDFWGDGLQPNCGIDIVRFDEVTRKYEILRSNKTYYDDSIKAKITQLL